MKRVLNFGSINIDHVYSVEHFVRPGETISCQEYRRFAYFSSQIRFHQPAEKVHVVDSTGAGDTFIGFFLAELINTNNPKAALGYATRAAAICVTRHGAADSIPSRRELEAT